MAKVHIIYRILPTEVGDDILAAIIRELKERVKNLGADLLDYKEEPIAFGLKALLVLFSLEEKEGALQAIEELLSSIDKISNWEVVRLTRY